MSGGDDKPLQFVGYEMTWICGAHFRSSLKNLSREKDRVVHARAPSSPRRHIPLPRKLRPLPPEVPVVRRRFIDRPPQYKDIQNASQGEIELIS